MATAVGVLFALFMAGVRGFLFKILSGFPQILSYLKEYYGLITVFCLILPAYTVLDNVVLNDGGEKLSAAANVIQTVGNVVLL